MKEQGKQESGFEKSMVVEMDKAILIFSLFFVLGTGCSLSSPPAPESTPEFEITNPKEGENLVLQILPDKEPSVRFDVQSQSGIGRVTVSLKQGAWPDPIIVRAPLKGLEGFNLTANSQTVERLDLEIKAFTKDGELFEGRHLLDQAGYYEVSIPRALLGDDTSFQIQWIDFYR